MKRQLKSYFHGGIHPSDGTDKLLSSQKLIQYYIPNKVEISMMQSVGHICKDIVKKGDVLSLGQLIGIPQAFGTSNIHASVPGTVIDIISDQDEHGNDYDIVVIETDKEFDRDYFSKKKDYNSKIINISDYSREDIINAMKEGGIIGMGGAGFPTHIKYETTRPIETVLINAAECEPYLTCDHRIMLEYSYDIINGVHLMIKAAGAKKAIICLEDNKIDAAEALEKTLEESGLDIEVKLLATRYPQGGERQLVEAVIGSEIPVGKLPAELGVIVSNVGTAKAVADMVLAGEPLISRCITITGAVNDARNYIVPIGTLISELLEESKGISSNDNKVIHGGPMTGTCIATNSDGSNIIGGVLKVSSGIVVLADEEIIESPCIRCGACEKVCPAGLAPFKIDFAAIEDDISVCDILHATECISCGACSYVCPAKRELAWRITVAKTEIFNQRHREGGK